MKKTHLTVAALMLCCATSSQIFASSNDEDQPQIAITHPSLTRIQDDITRMCVFSILQPHHAKHLDGIVQGLADIQDEDVRIQVASALSPEVLTYLDDIGAQNIIATLARLPRAEDRAHVMSLITPELIKTYKQQLPMFVALTVDVLAEEHGVPVSQYIKVRSAHTYDTYQYSGSW
ncbi:MAG: hypothetical protein H2057_08095 [Alphaproteobacteria bacterium]|nr:hypothetical protein [Alphaproteobacteria bacterium]